MLFTHRDQDKATELLPDLVKRLIGVGLITDLLACSSSSSLAKRCSTCMSIVRLPEESAPPDLPRPLRFRRMDLKVYPFHQIGYALLYFTGSAHFNRSMRFHAKRNKGLSLSDTGLKPTAGAGPGRFKASNCGEYAASCEQDVFRHLDLEYVAPHDRNV